jgi:hypothetical protein
MSQDIDVLAVEMESLFKSLPQLGMMLGMMLGMVLGMMLGMALSNVVYVAVYVTVCHGQEYGEKLAVR